MAMQRRTNGEVAVHQTKDGHWRATVDIGWTLVKRQRKHPFARRTTRCNEGAGR